MRTLKTFFFLCVLIITTTTHAQDINLSHLDSFPGTLIGYNVKFSDPTITVYDTTIVNEINNRGIACINGGGGNYSNTTFTVTYAGYDLYEKKRGGIVYNTDRMILGGAKRFQGSSLTSFFLQGPSPDGDQYPGDTLLTADSMMQIIDTLIVDGNFDHLYPNAFEYMIEDHDHEAFNMNGEDYMVFSLFRRERVETTPGDSVIAEMQATSIWKMDPSGHFDFLIKEELDTVWDYSVESYPFIDAHHSNEFDVYIYQEGGREKALIGVSNRNNSTMYRFEFDDHAFGTSLDVDGIVGEPFPLKPGTYRPFLTMEDDSVYPLKHQHGAVVVGDSLMYTLNNGDPYYSAVKQPLSYNAYRIDGDTATNIGVHVVTLNGDTVYSSCCGGTRKLTLDGLPPIIMFGNGKEHIEQNGAFYPIDGDSLLDATYPNITAMIPPPFGNWDTVFTVTFPFPQTTRNSFDFVTWDRIDHLGINEPITVIHTSDSTLLWHPNVSVWDINHTVVTDDTLSLPGQWGLESLKNDVGGWALDSLFMWQVRFWDNPVWLSSDNRQIDAFNMHPNPADDQVTIVGIQPKSVVVQNLQGQVVYRSKRQTTLDVSNLVSGVYLVTVETPKGKNTKKLILQ